MDPVYLSNRKPNFEPFEIDCGRIRGFQFRGNLRSEFDAQRITGEEAVGIYEDMLVIREFEEMIVKLRSVGYEPLANFDYRGPTHVSIGQEGCSVGACVGLQLCDKITSTHRGHADSVAKGTVSLRQMSDDQLRERVPDCKAENRAELFEAAMEDHLYLTIAELFGKDDGYCRGRGGSMHIADYKIGHLGANAIVGGGVPIATGAALGVRFINNLLSPEGGERKLNHGGVVCCFAGDGAYSNGVVLEALNFAAQHQFTNELAQKSFGLPIIFFVENNHYGMTHRSDDEVFGISTVARRASGFAENNMHAEVVNGMDPLAVRDAVLRGAEICRKGEGPVMIEASMYRYYGHSLSDPRTEYRTKDEEAAWKEIDPITTFRQQLLDTNAVNEGTLEELEHKVRDRNARAAQRAAESPDPEAKDVITFMYTDTRADTVPAEYANPPIVKELPVIKRTDGKITYRDALKEALVQEMQRDARVIFYGEDVAEYGGAFKLTKGLLEAFGRDRVFNTPISEACICGTAVGAAMVGLRPVVELMYMDFSLMASDQISNQAAKWHYMSGAQTEVPMVVRASVGGGKGYGGQHSQTLETIFAHIPGTYVVYPADPYDAKGLLKSAIRDNNPVMFVESQLLYSMKGEVPEDDYTVPLGQAVVRREGKDMTFVAWGPAVQDCLKAAEQLQTEKGVSAEVVDIRCLVPLDMDTILRSARKTGRIVVASQAIHIGSFTGEIASTISAEAFDYLDAPVVRVGAKNGIAPQSHILEAAFLPDVNDLVVAAGQVL